jgi:ankyrin repeat protein/WD40 repeat protein
MRNDNDDALHRASERGGYWAIIDELLQNGADVDAIDRYGKTPLHCAAGASALGGINIYAVRKLVSAGANVNAQDGLGRTALWFAIVDASRYANTPDKKNEVEETVDILLSANADPNLAAFNGMTPLIEAVTRDFVRIVSAMTSKKNVEVSLKNGVEALFAASELGHAEVARCLLINGVDANAQRSDGETPLAIAIENGHLEIARILLAAGADSNAYIGPGRTAISIALSREFADLALALHESTYGASPGSKILPACPIRLLCEIPARVTRHKRTSALDATGKTLLTISPKGTACVYDLVTGGKRLEIEDAEGVISQAVFDLSGGRFLTVSDQGVVRIWNTTDGALQSTLRHQNIKIVTAAFIPGKDMVLTTGSPEGASIWEIEDCQIVRSLQVEDEDVVLIAINSDGCRGLTVGRNGVGGLWDLAAYSLIRKMSQIDFTGDIDVVFCDDRSRIALADRLFKFPPMAYAYAGFSWNLGKVDRQRLPFELQRGEQEIYLKPMQGWALHSLSSDPTGAHLLITVSSSLARDFKVPALPSERKIYSKHEPEASGVWIMDDFGNNVSFILGSSDRILSARFNSLGNAIITSSADGAVRLWDPKSGRQIGVTLRHDQCIVDAAFNANGDRIVTECQDGFCRIWICDQQSLGLRSQTVPKTP